MVAFLIACIIVEITPGPNMATLAALTLARGLRPGLFAVAGVALGLATMGALAILGLAAIVTEVPALYGVLRWTGFLYLLWLAWEIWRQPGETGDGLDAQAGPGGLFWRGFLTNVLNPKAAVFFITVLPTFVPEGSASEVRATTWVYAAAYVGIATAIHTIIVLAAARLQGILGRSTGIARFRAILAALLVGVAGWLLWATRL